MDIGRTESAVSVYLDGKLVRGPSTVDSAVAVSESDELFTGNSAREFCREEPKSRYLMLFDPIPESEYLFGSSGIETITAIGRFLSDLLTLAIEDIPENEHYRTVVIHTDDFEHEENYMFLKGAEQSTLDPDALIIGTADLLFSYDELGESFTMAVEMGSDSVVISFTDEVKGEGLAFWGRRIDFSKD